MAEIPVIETKRLRLRAHHPSDLNACAQMWGDPTVTKYIGGRPFTREEVWARMLRYVGHWNWLGYGFWIIENRSDGEFVGEVGLAEFKRDIAPPLASGPEAGWALASHARGKGFATEALRAVTEWNEKRPDPKTVSCIVHPENLASIKVATKCGFKDAGRAVYKGSITSVLIKPWQPAAQPQD
jgi:RimJ/RimL family protein N-acetyltransferase